MKSEYEKRRAQQEVNEMLEAAEYNCGIHTRAITNLVWKDSRFCIQFMVDDKQKQIDIAPECRKRFKGQKLDKQLRKIIEDCRPDEIGIETGYRTYYQQNKAYNIGGIRYTYSVNETDLNNWLDKAKEAARTTE